jgi:hypothetical protein
MIVSKRFHEIPRRKFDVIKLRKIKNMRFGQHGRGNIQRVTNVHQIIEKVRISQFFGILIYVLFFDMTFGHQFSPNSHTRIIHKKSKKVNYLAGIIRNSRLFLRPFACFSDKKEKSRYIFAYFPLKRNTLFTGPLKRRE